MARTGGHRTAARERVLRTRAPRRPALPPPTTAPVLGLAAPVVRTADVVADRPADTTLTVTFEAVVDGDAAINLWELYQDAIAPLNQVAAMQHLDSREHMLSVFAEPEVTKIIAWERGTPVGLGLITKNLGLVPEASPAFFANHYPEHAERDAIFYGMAVLVRANVRGMSVFSRIYLEMWQIPARVGGVLVFDMCKFNRDTFNGDLLVGNIAANFPNSSWKVLDQQIWYAAELPEPLP